MKLRKFDHLANLTISEPCHEDWEGMTGDDARRFCGKCALHVTNLSALDADEAESLLSQPGRVCVRATIDPVRGVRTRDGWIPRALAFGLAAAALAGCMDPGGQEELPTIGKIAVEHEKTSDPKPVMGDVAVPPKDGQPTMGAIAPVKLPKVGKTLQGTPAPKK